MLIIASALAAASPTCQPVSIKGMAVLGFEASYVVPAHGELRRHKIWVENANMLAASMDRAGIPRSMWRRAPVKVSGCLVRGRFGHLGGYNHQLRGATFAK